MSALLALAGTIYLALPTDWKAAVLASAALAVQFFSSLGTQQLAVMAVVALLLAFSLVLLFASPYRRHSYFATTPSLIPSVSVYLDAENQLTTASVPPFVTFLMEHIGSRRADLLYFLDASLSATSPKYKALYRFGFRPIDVPHNPTGKQAIKEAVDKELAMHAYERALLGPTNQEFIIVTGDQDFVHLVYRLVALGHRVQVWATPMLPAYRTLATYLDVVLVDLTQLVSELEVERRESSPAEANTGARMKAKPATGTNGQFAPVTPSNVAGSAKAAGVPESDETLQDVLDLSGERAFYRAITATLKAYDRSKLRLGGQDRYAFFRSILGGDLKPQLAQVGYSVGNKLDYWLEHLIAVGIFTGKATGQSLQRGSENPNASATRMFAMTQAATGAVVKVAATHNDGIVRMAEVAAALAAKADGADGAVALPLLHLFKESGAKRAVHARYFVRGARALGLIQFEDMRAFRNLEEVVG